MGKTAVDVLEDLQAAGFGEREAKAVVRAVASLTAAELATKADLLETKAELRNELKALEIRLIKWYVPTSIFLAGTVAMIVALIK
jgi:hypothetical protein